MYTSKILMEVKAPDGQKIKGAEINLMKPIKNYIVYINDTNGRKLEFKNMEAYGWAAIHEMNIEEAEKKLKERIEQELGSEGQADVIMLNTHGASLDEVKGKLIVYTENNSTQSFIQTDALAYYIKLGNKDLDKLSLEEEEDLIMNSSQKALSLDLKKRKKERAERAGKRKKNAEEWEELIENGSKKEKKKAESEYLEQKRKDKREEIEDRIDKEEDDRDEVELRKKVNDEKGKIKKIYTDRSRIDITALSKIIGYVAEGKSFVFWSCFSAAYDSFIEYVLEITANRVNLYGFTNFCITTFNNEQSDPDSLFDAAQNLDPVKRKRPYTLCLKKHNTVVKGYLIGHSKGNPVTYNDITIIKNGIEIR